MKRLPITLVIFFTLPLIACCGPDKWTERIDTVLRCNMPVVQVENVSSRKIIPLEKALFGWATHLIKDDKSRVYLGFKKNQLKWFQIHWNADLMRTAMYERVDLCKASSTLKISK